MVIIRIHDRKDRKYDTLFSGLLPLAAVSSFRLNNKDIHTLTHQVLHAVVIQGTIDFLLCLLIRYRMSWSRIYILTWFIANMCLLYYLGVEKASSSWDLRLLSLKLFITLWTTESWNILSGQDSDRRLCDGSSTILGIRLARGVPRCDMKDLPRLLSVRPRSDVSSLSNAAMSSTLEVCGRVGVFTPVLIRLDRLDIGDFGRPMAWPICWEK